MHKFVFGLGVMLFFIFLGTFLLNTYVLNDIENEIAALAPAATQTPKEAAPLPDKTSEDKKPQEEPEEETAPEPEPEPGPVLYNLRLSVVGDIMLHITQYEYAVSNETGECEFDSCFELVTPYLSAADIAIGNIETVLGGLPFSGYPMFSAPDSFGYALKNAGFDLFTTANNHSLDKREAPLLRALDFLDELGIKHTGTFRSQEERDNILLIEQNNISIAFLSYTYGTNGMPIPQGMEYIINLMDEELIISDIKRAKELEPDFIIVMPHMGNEYETKPRDVFKDWVKLMLENGADIVLASHPHVIQPFEMAYITDENGDTRECAVAYSMGNFISGQRTEPREEGVILNFELEKTEEGDAYISEVSFIPTWVMYTNGSWQPEIKVLPIGDMLLQNETDNPPNVRPQDIERMNEALSNLKQMMLGDKAANENGLKTEYIIYEAERGA